MDRSFLTNADVIKASRDFVCIRLATYEDDAEAEYLKTIYLGRNGDLENTVFCLLSPDGDENLCRAGRGPQFAFRNPRDMASEMNKIAKQYQAKPRADGETILPEMKDIRLGINVSSCDGIPSIICYSKDEQQLAKMKSRLAPLAVGAELGGKFVYSSTTDADDLKQVAGFEKASAGILIVAPDSYGLEGEVKRFIAADQSTEAIAKVLTEFASDTSKTTKNHGSHVRKGIGSGKDWKTAIPVTDQGSLKAMQRRRGK